jgi:hypothetical protein
VPSQLANEGTLPPGRDRVGQIERYPAAEPLDVGAPTAVRLLVEMQERRPAHVVDAATLLDHAGPGADLGERVGEIVEELGRAAGHGGLARTIHECTHRSAEGLQRALG